MLITDNSYKVKTSYQMPRESTCTVEPLNNVTFGTSYSVHNL